MQLNILSLEQSVFIEHGVSGHADGDEQVRVRVQVNHLNALHRDVPGADGTVDVLHNLGMGGGKKTSSH